MIRAVVPLAFVGVFFVWPVAAIIGRSWSAGALRDVLADEGFRHVMWFTLWQSVLATALTLLVGLPAAYVVARYDFRGRRLFRAFVTIPFVLPTVVVATAFLVLFRRDGPLSFLGWQRGVGPLLVAEVFFNVAVVVRTVGGFWSQLDPRRTDAARVLGASRFRAFREVTLPLLGPPLAAAASIVFLFTFTAFGVVLLLADPAHSTIEVEIYRQAVNLFDLPTAAALAVVQMAAVIAILLVMARFQERRAVTQRLVAARDAARRPRGRERWTVGAVLALTGVFLGGPMLVLAVTSVRVGGDWSLASYRALGSSGATDTLFVPAWEAIRNSIVFASVAALDRRDRRRPRRGHDRLAAGARDTCDGHAADAPARHVGRDDRFRLPGRARPRADRPAGQDGARSARAGGRRDPVRDPRGRARAAVDRPAPA